MKLSRPYPNAFPLFVLAATLSFARIGVTRQIVDSRTEQPSEAEVSVFLDDLNDMERRPKAMQRLHATPVTRWIAPLRERLRRVVYEDDDALRAAYEVLSYGARDEWSDGEAAATDAVLVELLIAGTRSKYAPARRDCAEMLGRAPELYDREVVEALRLVLGDEHVYTVTRAACSLGNVGPNARAALPELALLLANPNPRTRQALETTMNEHLAKGGRDDIHLEDHLRTAVALARLQIGGVGIDLEEYPKLDDTGRAAAAAALVGIYQSAFYPLYNPRLRMLEGMDRERLLELHLRVSTLLVELFQQPRVSPRTRENMLRVVGGQVAFETIDPQVWAKASELIELAAQSDDDELRTLAEKIKTDRARRAR